MQKNLQILVFHILFVFLSLTVFSQATNSAGQKMVAIPPGKFLMGSSGFGENYDESPAHVVTISYPFLMSSTEVTNAQYEMFDPNHAKFRGQNGLSVDDDEPVVYVSFADAVNFCKWLSHKENKLYRLPTEAEWEYACRAGSFSAYSMNEALPQEYLKNQELTWSPKPVQLNVGKTPPNEFGLYDMHGNVEEWCSDWYGPYESFDQINPVGRKSGLFRVTRGGSHSTPARYLRSANRMAMIPEDKHGLTGFRVVQAAMPPTLPLPSIPPAAVMSHVKQNFSIWIKPATALFSAPATYVNKPAAKPFTPYYAHNHCPAITWCPNGDLLAIWFSTEEEAGREMVILGSRLRKGNRSWDPASLFFKVPDRNMTGSSLLNDGKGTIYYMNGVEAAGSWQNLAMVLRISRDNGSSWSTPLMADSQHRRRNQVIAGMLQTKERWLIQAGDAVPGGEGGTALHISKDNGLHWVNPDRDSIQPVFKTGNSGGLIAGIHASVVQLKDGSLLAFGRGNNIQDSGGDLRMPMSLSKNMGESWTYYPSRFPPIAGGQRLALMRLNEGAILLVSFTHHPIEEKDNTRKGMVFTDAAQRAYKGYGMFAAISFDEGKTWPVKKLLTDGKQRFLNGGAWTGFFEMNRTHAEPRGYLAITQTPDDIIHLISSNLYYRFNLKWLIKPLNCSME